MAFQVFKRLLVLCLLQLWTDFDKTYGLPSQRSKNFNDKWPYRENTKLHENSFEQREKIHEPSSWRKTAGKSQQLEELFKLEYNKDENSPISLKTLLNRYYHKSKSTKKEYSSHKSTTSTVQSVRRVNKDYVFRDIIPDDRLNSYAVAYSPREHVGTNWYIIAGAGFVILVVVLAVCVHVPWGCLWKRQRSEHDVSCPITGSHKGMCGKCVLHSNAATKTMTYEEKPHRVSVTMATSDRHHRPSSGNYSRYTMAHGTKRPGKLNQAKSKVSNLFKGSHGSHLYEPSGYRYKPLRNTEKRDSLHTTYEPEWTSIGAFLNRRPSTYGSTRESEGRFVDRYGGRSRDSLDAGDEVVEYALKLRPRRRQVIELQEFPLGFSKSYLNIDLESDPGVVFDPCRDQLYRKKTRTSERLTFSDSDLRKLSCTDKLGTYDESENLFDVGRQRKSSLKTRTRRGKANAKVVHFFPSNFSYDAQFVQIPPKNKTAETKVGEFERRFNSSYRESQNSFQSVDTKSNHESTFNPTKAGYNELTRIVGNTMDEFPFTHDSQETKIKEHAVDCDMQGSSMEDKSDEILQARDCASSYVNYGCRSSTEVLTDSKEKLLGNVENKQNLANNFGSMSSSFTDLCKNDLDCQPEPLAGLLSPIRRVTPKGGTVNGIVTSQAAGDLVCVTSYVQPPSSSKYAVPHGNNIYQPQLDDTTRFKSSQSRSQVLGIEKTSRYESLQQFPEKETRTEN